MKFGIGQTRHDQDSGFFRNLQELREEVGPRLRPTQCFRTVGRFAYNRQPPIIFDQRSHTGEEKRMVINKQNSYRAWLGVTSVVRELVAQSHKAPSVKAWFATPWVSEPRFRCRS